MEANGNLQSFVLLFSSHTTRGGSNLSFYSWFCVQTLEEIKQILPFPACSHVVFNAEVGLRALIYDQISTN